MESESGLKLITGVGTGTDSMVESVPPLESTPEAGQACNLEHFIAHMSISHSIICSRVIAELPIIKSSSGLAM